MPAQNPLAKDTKVFDFHTHTFLSDGELAPTELIRRAVHIGYQVIAVTDHVGPGNLEFVIKTLVKDCELASRRWDILALPGVEITYAPVDDIDVMARDARALGAKMVNVHGETVVEPVEPGTNHAAVSSMHVDILAHPGLITSDDARKAAENGIFLEVSARRGHGFANGHVVRTAKEAGAGIVLDSDAHAPEDLLTREFALKVARGAGLDDDEANMLLDSSPLDVLKKIGVSYP
ncbi:MAG: histidinol phosphate phosphatase domain-containing protein [Chloroflexi bacterium]|nr:histidinol phosphate phosphatase domain-containing protein [Chloroflexota bacterium]MCI0822850.1 histidinol phosphate phosphatase domain-containing protein [Chloroflexota bacterium]MCI0869569.1 histidinol phosphate phosphatase domain-containing protein [Chloroflexota bacterium]